MRKKILILIITLIGMISLGKMYMDRDIEAAANIGGEVYGRIGAPIIGDRIFLGTKSNLNKPMGWVLLKDYSVSNSSTGFIGTDSILALSTSVMDRTTYYDNTSEIYHYVQNYDAKKTAVWKKYDIFNNKLTSNTQDMKLVAPRHSQWQSALLNSAKVLFDDPVVGVDAIKNLDEDMNNENKASIFFKKLNDSDKAKGTARLYSIYQMTSYGVPYSTSALTGNKVAYPCDDWNNYNKVSKLWKSAVGSITLSDPLPVAPALSTA